MKVLSLHVLLSVSRVTQHNRLYNCHCFHTRETKPASGNAGIPHKTVIYRNEES